MPIHVVDEIAEDERRADGQKVENPNPEQGQ
jgi:hypothetical protein